MRDVLVGGELRHVLEHVLEHRDHRLERFGHHDDLENGRDFLAVSRTPSHVIIVLRLVVIVALALRRIGAAALGVAERARRGERADRTAEQREHGDDREQPAQQHLPSLHPERKTVSITASMQAGAAADSADAYSPPAHGSADFDAFF